ncbi:flagellar protein FlhE [Stutzerimonas stutzeri]|uniref:flagellar protein FlhE n=1 Tax=Stutzerimonas stutzeri TaxID=316 RepID=UPI003C6F6B0D
MPFTVPTTVPRNGASVTSVNYTWSSYNNGNTSEIVELCYSPQYSSSISNCVDISAAQSGTSTAHAGYNARGQFWIRHTISGGSYPAISTSSDLITVNYSF